MKKILVTGSLAYDYIMDFDDTYENNILPEKIKTLSISFLLKTLHRNYGGVAGNISYTLSLLGEKPSLYASLGEKDGDDYIKRLKNLGIDITPLKVVKGAFSANAFMMTDKNNCQITGFYPGALANDVNLSLQKISHKESFDFIIVGTTNPIAMTTFSKEAKTLKIPYLINPAQELPRFTKEQLQTAIDGAYAVIGNDYELSLLCKISGYTKNQLLDKTRILITTMGEDGSLVETKKEKIKVGIVKIDTVLDPTGAGDSYIAGFVSGYMNGKDLKTCGQMAATAASFAIEHYGTQSHTFTAKTFEKRYQEAFS